MALSKKVKFYNPNEVKSDNTFVFTTANTATAPLIFDRDLATFLVSDASAEGVNEKWKFTFAAAVEIDFVAIFGHNIKTGNIKYLDAGLAETDFTSAIAFVNNTDTDNSYEVTKVTAYGIVVNCTNTIDTGEKKAAELIAALKIGEVAENPFQVAAKFDIKADIQSKIDGGVDKIVNGLKFRAKFQFDNASESNDLPLFLDLYTRGRPFYTYPGGGFDYAKRFFRIEDIYLVNLINNYDPKLPDGQITDVGWIINLDVKEV